MKVSFDKRNIDIMKVLDKPNIKDMVIAVVALMCQRTPVLGMYPFGCAAFSALCRTQTAYLTIPSITVGMIFSGAPPSKYLTAILIIFLVKTLAPNILKKRIYSFLLCPISLFFCGIYGVFSSSSPTKGLIFLIMETIFASIGHAVFSNAEMFFKEYEKNMCFSKENSASLLIAAMITISGLSGIILPFSISPISVILIYSILCMTMYSSIPSSMAYAVICGFVGSLYKGNAVTTSGVYALGTAFSGMMKIFGPFASSVGFLTGVTVSALLMGDMSGFSLSVADVFIASSVFVALPLKYHQRQGIFLSSIFKSDNTKRDFRIKEYITEELNCFSHTLYEFSRQFKSAFSKETFNISPNPSELFDETAERICSKCGQFKDCWQKNFNDTYKYMFSILEETENNGYCDTKNAPIVFLQRCIQPDLFLNEFSHVYETMKQRLLYSGSQTFDRGWVSSQYKEISKIISELSEEIEGSFFFDEEKENKIMSLCLKEGIYLKDINVIRTGEGYYEVYFSKGEDNDNEDISKIASEVTGMKLEESYCKNNALIKLSAAGIYDIEISVCQKKKDDEPVSGDTVIHFNTDKNKYYIILCDGMGSGKDASKESRMTSELLAGFLKAGFSKNTAINLINSTLALKMEREGFSTIDLCEIDLRSGKTEFIKIGGAQSYVLKDNNVETVFQKGLPAGICESISVDNLEEQLGDGDMIVMVSDGVSEAGYGMMRGEWIKRLMKLEGLTTDELSKSIVTGARNKIYPRIPDDMTAVVIKIKIAEALSDIPLELKNSY